MSTIQPFLRDITKALANFLLKELPRVKDDWWDACVISSLTPQQLDHIERRRVGSISGLDLAALLRVTDRNWDALSTNLKWPREVRHFIRETQSVRNRHAHGDSNAEDPEDVYRDLDTLQRLSKAIGAEQLANELALAKRHIVSPGLRSVQGPPSSPDAASPVPDPPVRTSPKTQRHRALLLIGCVKTKLSGRHKARDLFVSPLFKGRRAYAEATGGPWFILSAKYGLVDPGAEIDSYNVSLKNMSKSERQQWCLKVLHQLKEAVGNLAGKVVEIHAGAAYRESLLVDGLRTQGAVVVVALEHEKQGAQLAWYAAHARGMAQSIARPGIAEATPNPELSRTRPASHDVGTAVPLHVVASKPLPAFSYRWPVNTEAFASGWEMEVQFQGRTHIVRYAVGRRHCFGRSRVHTVAWVDERPMVEGAEAEDFVTSGELVSVLKERGTNRDAASIDSVEPAYAAFRIVRHCDAITGVNARRGLAVRLRKDDLKGWAWHALLRASTKESGARRKARPPRVISSTQMARIPTSATDVVRALLDFGARLSKGGHASFTPDVSADAFVRSDAFAFLVAVICDEQVRFERAWEAPLRLRERLGHWDIRRIAEDPGSVRIAFAAQPALHRWTSVTADRVVAAAKRVVVEYQGDALRLWGDHPTAQELRERLERFEGIGQKKSAMAVELLERSLGVPLGELHGSDVAVDVHVRRVFLRSGIASRDDVAHMVDVARIVNPVRPGALDHPAWEIGRSWCRPTLPNCEACPIGQVCPRLVDRADGVRGA